MNPQNKKAIDNEYSSSSKNQSKRENLRHNETKSSESCEQTNISESIVAPKRKKQFHGVENENSESNKEEEREIDFWKKNEKQKVLNIKTIKKEKIMQGQRKIMMKFKKIKPEKILLI
jgi:hypothetical protein